jgi:hypothetical protein
MFGVFEDTMFDALNTKAVADTSGDVKPAFLELLVNLESTLPGEALAFEEALEATVAHVEGLSEEVRKRDAKQLWMALKGSDSPRLTSRLRPLRESIFHCVEA